MGSRKEALRKASMCWITLIGTFCAVLYAGVAPSYATPEQPTPEALTWVAAQYDQFMSQHFARPEQDSSFKREHEPIITVRISGESVLETQVTVFAQQGKIQARVLQAERVPISDQLLKLHEASPEADASTIFAKVARRSFTVDSTQRARLSQIFRDFRRLKTSVFVDSTIYASSIAYQIWVTGIQEQKSFKILAPDPFSKGVAYWGPRRNLDNGLLLWIGKLLSELKLSLRPAQ